jgi:multicomponent Na+:H+ antiporter subunit G
MLETIAYWVLGIGVAFELIGSIGLLRLPDVYDRAVAATKCVTMGTCMMLLGVAIYGAAHAGWSMAVKALLCAAFILMTNPVAAHAVLRAAYISGVPMSDDSVEDAFAARAGQIRRQHAAELTQLERDDKPSSSGGGRSDSVEDTREETQTQGT